MKSGKSIVELAKVLEDVSQNSNDYLVPIERMRMTTRTVAAEKQIGPRAPVIEPVMEVKNGGNQHFHLNNWASGQLSTYTNIPRAYFDRIRNENPVLFANNINHGLDMKEQAAMDSGKPDVRLLRTYKDTIRAVLSSRYRMLDCIDLLQVVLPILTEHNLQVKSCEYTEQRMYIKVVSPNMLADVRPNDTVQFGLVISSSDVGAGTVRVEPFLFRLICTNGMIALVAIKKMHVGRNQVADDVLEILADETKEKTDEAFWMQVRDVTIHSLKPDVFQTHVNRLKAAAEQPITDFNTPRVVEKVTKHLGITHKGVQDMVAHYLANGADGAGMNKWGLAQAVSFAASNETINYDQSTDLERAAAQVIDLNNQQWKHIAQTAA